MARTVCTVQCAVYCQFTADTTAWGGGGVRGVKSEGFNTQLIPLAHFNIHHAVNIAQAVCTVEENRSFTLHSLYNVSPLALRLCQDYSGYRIKTRTFTSKEHCLARTL